MERNAQEKAVYHNLNLLQVGGGGMLRAEGWCVTSALDQVRSRVSSAHTVGGLDSSMPSVIREMDKPWPEPPTHFELNKFTKPFQALVDTYGVPRYREINPALFTAVTFPFLFGVMHGDVGHGFCLFLAGLYLVLTESSREGKKLDELTGGLHLGRYMILMMGFFAVYCGLIYNDCLSLALDLMPGGTRWEYQCCCQVKVNMRDTPMTSASDHQRCMLDDHGGLVYTPCPWGSTGGELQPTICPDPVPNGALAAPTKPGFSWQTAPANFNCAHNFTTDSYGVCPSSGNVYPFGVDPNWHGTTNELLFYNSMKMKLSVILGIFQMFVGICLKGLNAIYTHSWYDFFFEFIPQVVFATCLFVYMIILIVVKWSINWNERMTAAWENGGVCPYNWGNGGKPGGCDPPPLITTLINMALMPGSVEMPMFPGQQGLQVFLILAAVLSVPAMLVIKPYLLNKDHKRQLARGHRTDLEHGGGGHGHGPFNFGEIVIHQAIETIEFVLGMISNTASYLRLWALSLAHTELAKVFWEKIMMAGIESDNPVGIFIAFALFAGVTFAVLLSMDVLECFLHALRLHWVEFQNKFYKADGYKFEPLHFKQIFEDMD